MPTQKIQFKMKYNGTEYEFSIDPVATEGSGNPVASNALHELALQLRYLLTRGVATPTEPHERTWVKRDGRYQWAYLGSEDTSLVTAEAMLDVIDWIRENWIDPIIAALPEGSVPGYQVTGS